MKPCLTILPFVFAVAVAQAAPSAGDAAVRAAIDGYYGRPLPSQGCQLAAPPKGSQWLGTTNVYCMKPAAANTVKRNGKTVSYVLYTGFMYDTEQKQKNDAHAATGLAELFVMEKQGGSWKIAMSGKQEIGAWGETPEPEAWTFVQTGRQNWGYTAETGYTAQGEHSTAWAYLFTDNRNRVVDGLIRTGLNNAGYYGDCSDRTGQDKRNCLGSLTDLSAKLTFRRDRVSAADVYVVEAALSGSQGKKRYRGRKYLIGYDSAKSRYVAPKDYPLGNSE
ncbi:hypothetical protein [Neisseria sp.]|uniref:hypothetical protein n=1 Tax=Neisseria sp. TaxID=192066 RepID=UPI0035A06ECB